MAIIEANGVKLFYEQSGAGDPLVLVHGSWGDHHNWDAVVPELAKSFRVTTYDRRGHSLSERPSTQGSFREDAEDLAALIERLKLGSAHIIGNSGGAAIVLRLAGERPDLFRTMIVHEPPLFMLLSDVPDAAPALQEFERRAGAVIPLLEAGRNEDAAQQFVETIAFGPGAWAQLPEAMRKTFTGNAPTFLDESRDSEGLTMDLGRLKRFSRPALLTRGTTSAPFFPAVVGRVAKALPNAEEFVFDGAGHVPHVTHPVEYVDNVRDFIARHKR